LAGLVIKRFANFITFLNLIFGSAAIIYTINEKYDAAGVLILLAVLMDSLDGKIARRLQTSSDFGKELDSLCDMVSFGVAPAVLIYAQILIEPYTYIGLAAALLFIACGAFRLARFNILNLNGYFLGLPITLAGGFLAVFALLGGFSPLVFLLLLVALSIFMVSTINIPKI